MVRVIKFISWTLVAMFILLLVNMAAFMLSLAISLFSWLAPIICLAIVIGGLASILNSK